MQYLLMICANEEEEAKIPAEAMGEILQEYGVYGAAMAEAGVIRDGNRLRPVETATTVRVQDGKTMTTDGPFAETKEQIGGYYLIDCANIDEAIAWAAKCPGARFGSIEVRPIWEMEDME